MQSRGFLGKLLVALLKTSFPLMKNVLKPLIKSILIILALTAVASAADPRIHIKILQSGMHLDMLAYVTKVSYRLCSSELAK